MKILWFEHKKHLNLIKNVFIFDPLGMKTVKNENCASDTSSVQILLKNSLIWQSYGPNKMALHHVYLPVNGGLNIFYCWNKSNQVCCEKLGLGMFWISYWLSFHLLTNWASNSKNG